MEERRCPRRSRQRESREEMSKYIFDNASERPTAQRFASLEALYDPRTTRILETTGVGA